MSIFSYHIFEAIVYIACEQAAAGMAEKKLTDGVGVGVSEALPTSLLSFFCPLSLHPILD